MAFKHDREIARNERLAAKAERKAERREARLAEEPHLGHVSDVNPLDGNGQFRSVFPNAPESAAGIARVLSRGI